MKLLDLKEIMALTGLARSTIYYHIKNNTFPAPQLKLLGKHNRWTEEQLENFLSEQYIGNKATK